MHHFIIKNNILKRYEGPGGDVQIPDGVTGIGDRAFLMCDSLTRLYIPDGVTSIGEHAFSMCNQLTDIRLPADVTEIGAYAFSWCSSLTHISLPDAITTLRRSVFSMCANLRNIAIPERVTVIEEDAFSMCMSLTHMDVPDGVTHIGDRAFAWCTNLTAIRIPRSVTALEKETFLYSEKIQRIVAPSVPFASYRTPALKRSAVLGFAAHPALYTDLVICAEYQKYYFAQKKKLLPLLFADDLVDGLALYAEHKKITPKNFEPDFLQPAIEARAAQCVAYLLNWGHTHLPSGGADFTSSL